MRLASLAPLRRVAGVALLLVALPLLAGCGGSAMGTVSGKITYKGNPVTVGSVNFMAPEKGHGADGKLGSGGEFTLAAPIPAGTYKVYIQPPIPEQLPPGTAPKPVERLNIPLKYTNLSMTTVKQEVKPGKNDIPIDLTD